MNRNNLHILVLTCLILLMGCQTETLPPSPSPANSPPPTSTASPTVNPLAPAGTMAATLTDSGPWLVIITPTSVWALNPDGSGLTEIYDGHVLAPQDTTRMPAPMGGTAAFITGDALFRDFHLNLLTFPQATLQTIQLVAPEYQTTSTSSPSDPALEATRALLELTSLAWAPDGNRLAFIAIRAGPTADLYLLDLPLPPVTPLEPGITRLTDTPTQNILPTWSPDGRYLLHAGVSTLGTGAGASLDGVWAFDTHTHNLLPLYTPEDSAAETFIGWQDADTFLAHSWTPVCGNEHLRAVDIPSGEARMIWEGSFNGVAFAPGAGKSSLLISNDTYTAGCKGTVGAGLFHLSGPDFAGFQIVLSEEIFLPVWSPESGLFFARTLDRVFGIRPENDMASLLELDAPAPVLPSVAPFGERLAWALRSGVWVGGFDTPATRIFSNPASLPIWGQAGEVLFFFAEGGMYIASAPDFTPQVLGEGLLGTGAFWVSP